MRIIFMPPYKSWFKGLGLHHALIIGVAIGIGDMFGFGPFMAAFGIGWYASREWGWDIKPPKTFEIMDFLSPAMLGAGYLYVIQG